MASYNCSKAVLICCSLLGVTVTGQVADLPPAVAVIVAVPSFKAFTVPLLTVTTVWSELDHVTVLSVAKIGVTVAVRLAVLPTSKFNVPGSSDTPETGVSVEEGPVSIGSSGPQATRNETIRIAETAALKSLQDSIIIASLFIITFKDK